MSRGPLHRSLIYSDRLSGLSEDTAGQCQYVRHDGVGTVIGEEVCCAVDDVPGEVVRLAVVNVEHARPDAGIGAAYERDGRDGEPPLAVRRRGQETAISGRMRFRPRSSADATQDDAAPG
jgi:hypothetical protein